MEGPIGSVFSRRFKAGKIDNAGIFLITAPEVCQMVIILFISTISSGPELVGLIAFPMITMNALGMVAFIGTYSIVFMEEDSQFAEKMRRLGIVEQSLPHLRKGFTAQRRYGSAARDHLQFHLLRSR